MNQVEMAAYFARVLAKDSVEATNLWQASSSIAASQMLWKEELRRLIPASILGGGTRPSGHRTYDQLIVDDSSSCIISLLIQNWAVVPFQNPIYLVSDFCSCHPLESRVVIDVFVFYR
jgi:hypothetical protein